jgi:lipoate-protein ligase A
MPECRLLPPASAGGPVNMAADEALLHSAVAGVASLRFYGWTEATLSLGYFQAAGPARASDRLAALPWVRRPTGGAALVHHHEVTYALALPAGAPWQSRGLSWLRRMHQVIRAALADCGVTARLCPPEGERKLGEVLCFLHLTPDDLLVGDGKVVGSAQRRHRGALLQHGGILLSTSPTTPELPGIAELSGQRLTDEDIRASVTGRLARETGWQVVRGAWTPDEHRRIAELAAGKYATREWNEKR